MAKAKSKPTKAPVKEEFIPEDELFQDEEKMVLDEAAPVEDVEQTKVKKVVEKPQVSQLRQKFLDRVEAIRERKRQRNEQK